MTRMVLISGSVDFARFACANHSSHPLILPKETVPSMDYLPSDFPGRLASEGTSVSGEGLVKGSFLLKGLPEEIVG